MRQVFVTLGLSAVLVGGTQTVFGDSMSDIHGTARVGDKSQSEVVVWVDVPGTAARADSKPVLDQRNFSFSPRVLAVQVGQVVEFPNHDRVFHNVFSFHDGKRFDLGMYPTGTMKRVTFDKPGLSRIYCNIHPQMVAYVLSVESAYFAVSDAQGRFVIRGVPPGTHSYHAWRSGASTISGSVATTAGSPLEIRWP
jgi:plastocyanin